MRNISKEFQLTIGGEKVWKDCVNRCKELGGSDGHCRLVPAESSCLNNRGKLIQQCICFE